MKIQKKMYYLLKLTIITRLLFLKYFLHSPKRRGLDQVAPLTYVTNPYA